MKQIIKTKKQSYFPTGDSAYLSTDGWACWHKKVGKVGELKSEIRWRH